MGKLINSFTFQQSSLLWIKAEIENSRNILVKSAVESPLPFAFDAGNLSKSSTPLLISSLIKSLSDASNMDADETRFTIPGRFGMVKKIVVDQYTPESAFAELVEAEMVASIGNNLDDYHLYQPEYDNERNFLRERLVISLRKQTLSVFQDIASKSGLELSEVNLNCFTIDGIFRRFYPNTLGESMLVNVIENGFEFIISDSRNFLNYFFKPYTSQMHTIQSFDETKFTQRFLEVFNELQNPNGLEESAYSIQQIFMFGNKLNNNLLDALKSEKLPPLQAFNLQASNDYQIAFEEKVDDSYRWVEALANIF